MGGDGIDVVSFVEALQHTKAPWAGKPFNLRPWQEHGILRPLFETLRDDGLRQYRTAYLSFARKNGKSELGAAIALYLLFGENEVGAEIYSAAADRDQAGIVFEIAAQMVRQNPTLSKMCRIIDSQKRIVRYDTHSIYRVISSEAHTKHGYNPSAVIYDELHAAPNRDLWDVLTTGSGTREQPLFVVLTTAGFDRESICYEQYSYAKQVEAGTVDDPTFFSCIYETEEDADWTDPETWKKANPALGEFLREDEMESSCKKAQAIPALQNTFRRLRLNQWTQQSNRWIDLGLWDENSDGPVDEEALVGRRCYGGLDLASTSDLNAWVMVFPRDDDPEQVDVLARFWCPESKLHDESNRYADSYRAWAREGWLTPTSGEAVDYGYIREQVLEDAQKFDLIDVNIDRLFQGYQLGQQLAEEGIVVIGFGQGFMSMAPAMRELDSRLLRRQIRHGDNPVLRWMADNVAVKEDAAGNLKPDKAKSQGKIDGIVALLMGLDRASRHEDTASVYEDRGLLVL